MKEGGLAEVVASISARSRLRTWSVIITFLGDAIVPRGGAVSARTVQEVLACLSIEPGRLRTAFSRLTKDDWLIRERVGRASYYRLSPSGLAPFARATTQIYAAGQPSPTTGQAWLLGLSDNGPDRISLRPDTPEHRDDLAGTETFLMSGTVEHLPEWLKNHFAEEHLRLGFENLLKDFAPLDIRALSDIEAMAARCLLIHEWRRLRLRAPELPPQFLPNDWPMEACLDFVAQTYHQLLPASERWLDDHATGPQGSLRPAVESVARRFR